LTNDQLRIYEDFGRSNRVTSANKQSRKHESVELDAEKLEVIGKFEKYVFQLDKELDYLAETQNQEKIKELQIVHKKVMDLVIQQGHTDEVIFQCTVKVLDPLFNQQISFKKINFFLAVLGELKRLNDGITTDILDWILESHDKRLMKTDIILKLIKESFINPQELDAKFKTLLEENPGAGNVFINLIKIIKALVVDEKLLESKFFTESLASIIKLIPQYKEQYPQISKQLEEFRTIFSTASPLASQTKPKANIPQDKMFKQILETSLKFFDAQFTDDFNQAYALLQEWLKLNTENESSNFIKVLETNIFTSDNSVVKFFTYLTDISVQYALDSANKMAPY